MTVTTGDVIAYLGQFPTDTPVVLLATDDRADESVVLETAMSMLGGEL